MLNLLYTNSAFKDILYTFYMLKNLNFDKIKKEQLRLRENQSLQKQIFILPIFTIQYIKQSDGFFEISIIFLLRQEFYLISFKPLYYFLYIMLKAQSLSILNICYKVSFFKLQIIMIFLPKNKSEAVERRGKNGGTSEVGSKGEDQGDDEDKNFILFLFLLLLNRIDDLPESI